MKDPEHILRLAGLLPPLAPPVQEEQEVTRILRSLPADLRAIALRLIRSLRPAATAAVAEAPAPYQIEPSDTNALESEIASFIQEFPELQVVIDEAKRRGLSDPAIRALITNVRIFTVSREERFAFSQIHQRLSETFNRLSSAG